MLVAPIPARCRKTESLPNILVGIRIPRIHSARHALIAVRPHERRDYSGRFILQLVGSTVLASGR